MTKSQQLKALWFKFFTWWTKSILLLLPMWLHQIVKPVKDHLIIECSAERIFFQFITAQQNIEEKYSCPLGDDIEIASACNWLKDKIGASTCIFLQVPNDKILLKELTLPAAARDNIRQVLSYEIDRHTPFEKEQAYFDFSIKNNHDNDKLHIMFYITPKNHIDQSLEKIKIFNILPEIACSNEMITFGPVLNFLPLEKRLQKQPNRNNSLYFFAATTLTMFLAVLYFPVFQLYHQAQTQQAEIALYQNKAITVKKLQEQKDKLLLKTDFLLIKQKEYFPAISLLNELTRILPDDTWLYELSITLNDIQIQGESDDASSIIELIESSRQLHDASFISPIINNNIGDKDKFKLSARLKRHSL